MTKRIIIISIVLLNLIIELNGANITRQDNSVYQILEMFEPKLQEHFSKATLAEWNYAVNITNENQAQTVFILEYYIRNILNFFTYVSRLFCFQKIV